MVDEAELVDAEPAELSAQPAASRRPLVAGAAAGLWALLVGVALVTCVVMLAWAVAPDPVGDSAAAWRAAGMTWLGAHLVPLELGGRALSLLPLGGPVLGLLLNRRGGRWAGRLLVDPTPSEAAGIVTAAATVYGLGGAGLAWLSGAPGSAASPMAALLGTGAVALVGTTWGIAGAAGLVEGVRSRLSQSVWRTILGGLAAVIGLLTAGCLLVSVSLIRHVYPATATLADLDAGVLGGAALTLVGVLCLPTLGVWGLSVVVGPGFQLGPENGLNAFGGQVDTLPALPVLAAVPAAMPGWAPVLLLVPIALGGLAGRIRWGRDLPTLSGSVRSAVVLAGVVGALVTGLVLLASGSLGGGRLESVGPQVLPVAGAAAGLVVLGFLADAGLQLGMLSWQLHRAEQRAVARQERADRVWVVPASGQQSAVALDSADRGDGPQAEAVGAAAPGPGAPSAGLGRSVDAAARAAAGAAGAAGALAAQGVSSAARTVRTIRPDRLARSIPLAFPKRAASVPPTRAASSDSSATLQDRSDPDPQPVDPAPVPEATGDDPVHRDAGDHTIDLALSEQDSADVRAAASGHRSGSNHMEP